jgi:hypothetical protein
VIEKHCWASQQHPDDGLMDIEWNGNPVLAIER